MPESKPEPTPDDDLSEDQPHETNVLARVVVLFLGVGAVGICGAGIAAVYYFQPHVNEDPAAVQPLMDRMFEIDMPALFVPRGTIEWNMAYMMSMQGTYFETADAEQDGTLMFVQVDGRSADKPEVREHIEQVLRESGNRAEELTLETDTLVERTVIVRGNPVLFSFETAVDQKTRTSYRLVHGVVDGREGQVLIALRIRQDSNWNDEIVIAMLESIR